MRPSPPFPIQARLRNPGSASFVSHGKALMVAPNNPFSITTRRICVTVHTSFFAYYQQILHLHRIISQEPHKQIDMISERSHIADDIGMSASIYQSMDIREIVTEATRGNRLAEEDLFGYLHIRFSIVAERRLGKQDAEDIVNEACITVLQKYKSLAPGDRFEPWAYKVLRNLIGSYLRDSSVRKRTVETTGQIDRFDAPIPSAVDPEVRLRLISCLRKVARAFPRYARAVNLVNLGYETDEICRRLKVSRSNLYVLLHRGRAWLAACMQGEYSSDD